MDIYKIGPQPTQTAPLPTDDFSLNYEEVKVTYGDPHKDKWIDILGW